MSLAHVLALVRKDAQAAVVVAALVVGALALLVWGPRWDAQASVDKRQDKGAVELHRDMRAVLRALGVPHPRHDEEDASEE